MTLNHPPLRENQPSSFARERECPLFALLRSAGRPEILCFSRDEGARQLARGSGLEDCVVSFGVAGARFPERGPGLRPDQTGAPSLVSQAARFRASRSPYGTAGEIGEPDFHLGPGHADGSDAEAHRPFLPREDVFDESAELRLLAVGSRQGLGRPLASCDGSGCASRRLPTAPRSWPSVIPILVERDESRSFRATARARFALRR